MRTLLDFVPIVLFFVAYKLHAWFGIDKEEAIYFATPILMSATALQMALIYAIDRKLTAMQKVTLGMVLVFGSVTLALHDKRFVMWKPTVLWLAIALGMAVAQWRMKINFLKSTMGVQLELPDSVWHKLSVAWVSFFVFLAGSNALVVAFWSEEDWVNFKVWGFGFWLVFFVGQGLFIAPYLPGDEKPDGGPTP